MRHIIPNEIIGSAQKRIDGLAKVTGDALFGADHNPPHAAHAWLVTSPIALGRIRRIDEAAARQIPGVLGILTYRNVGKEITPGKHIIDGGYMSQSIAPLRDDRIHFAGQIVAVVIAETPELAHAAADALVIEYNKKRPSATFDSQGLKEVEADAMGETELEAGNIEIGLRSSDAVIDAWYETPAQHQNPLELFQTTCAWDGDQVTVWESTQNVRGHQHGLAKQLGLSAKQVRFVSPFTGGAFGSRGELGQHTALIALAARRLGRPVKHVATRRQCFYLRTFRAETRHHIQLGADRDCSLTVLVHDSWEITSRTERFAVAGSDSTARMYACPNVRVKCVNLEADRQAPGYMRAPPEMPYMFAMESAMDELAYALKCDPLELRRRNDTMVETVTNLPYTSRSLVQCIDRGAEVFGWRDRDPKPRSMRDGDDLVGWGFASAFYPAMIGPAECRITLMPDLHAIAEVGTHEIGTGIRTVMAQTVADLLGLQVEHVEVRIGDSRLPATPMSAGSNTTASVCSVLAIACEMLRERIAAAASKAQSSVLYESEVFNFRLKDGFAQAGPLREDLASAVRRAGRGRAMIQTASNNPHGAPPLVGPALVRRGKPVMMGGSRLKDRMQFAHGAQFVEVRVNQWTGEIRVPRMAGVFCRRTHYESANGPLAIDERPDLGPFFRTSRVVGSRSGCPICKRRSGRISRPGQRGRSYCRDHHPRRSRHAH